MLVRVNQMIMVGDQDKEILIFLEVEQDSMRDLHEALAEDGALYGTRYYTTPIRGRGSSVFEITDRGETILVDGIVTIQEMRGTLLWPDGKVFWPEQESQVTQ